MQANYYKIRDKYGYCLHLTSIHVALSSNRIFRYWQVASCQSSPKTGIFQYVPVYQKHWPIYFSVFPLFSFLIQVVLLAESTNILSSMNVIYLSLLVHWITGLSIHWLLVIDILRTYSAWIAQKSILWPQCCFKSNYYGQEYFSVRFLFLSIFLVCCSFI